LLGSVAFNCISKLVRGEAIPSKAGLVQSAWLEINSTTAPPPAEQFRVLTNGMRLPAFENGR
jgi:hypothetical protein